MELYSGLGLHSRNTYIGIMDGALNRVFKKRGSLDNPSSCKVHFSVIQDIVAGQNTPRPVIEGLQTNYQAISDLPSLQYLFKIVALLFIMSTRRWVGQREGSFHISVLQA